MAKQEIMVGMLNERDFQRIREKVLKTWPTGKQVDLDEAYNFHRNLPRNKKSALKLASGKKNGIIFLQPRAGVALVEEQIKLLIFLRKFGRADFLPITIDAYTRHNEYKNAEKGIQASKRFGKSMLNGFPVVNEGVLGTRKIVEAVDVPAQIRHGTPDARLLAEISLAAGLTDFEGGGISYNIPYAKEVSLEESIRNWQYVDRLVGLYELNEIKINRESFGALTGTLVPPCISISVGIIEALLAAEQGVKNISLGYGQGGNVIQDVAAVKILAFSAEKYLNEFGYKDILLTTVFHQWMGGFPRDEYKAAGVIDWAATVGFLAKPNKIICKTTHEGFGVPTKESNLTGLLITREAINRMEGQKFLSEECLKEETEIINREVDAILGKVIELSGKNQDIAKGTILAFERGILDIHYSSSKFVLKNVLTARDVVGAIRFLRCGNLPFDKDLIEFHKAKMRERRRKGGFMSVYEMIAADVVAVSEGRLIGEAVCEGEGFTDGN